MIKLIVGLGNPSIEYKDTRHNIGFWFIENIISIHNISLKNKKYFHGSIGNIWIKNQKIYLLQPQTFMNYSGISVFSVVDYYKILPNEILIVHDELNLLPGIARFKLGGGTGGHKGIKNICLNLLTSNYWRLRIGIGHPYRNNFMEAIDYREDVSHFVLQPPTVTESSKIHKTINTIIINLDNVINNIENL